VASAAESFGVATLTSDNCNCLGWRTILSAAALALRSPEDD